MAVGLDDSGPGGIGVGVVWAGIGGSLSFKYCGWVGPTPKVRDGLHSLRTGSKVRISPSADQPVVASFFGQAVTVWPKCASA
jgi:hypothetical protein